MLILLATASLHAQPSSPKSDAGNDPWEAVKFVGHYGEILKLRADWQVHASMHGEAEVINHYPKFRFIAKDWAEPFNPKPEDFVPENFSRNEFVQMIVLPWSASSSKSLEELKRLKVADLRSTGVDFRILDNPFLGHGHWGQKWPEGTFEVLIATPYKLSQLYTTSGKHLVILTSGVDTPPSYAIGQHAGLMRSSLRDWIAPPDADAVKWAGPVPAPNVPDTGISLHVLAKPRVWMTWAFVNGLGLLLFSLLSAGNRWAPIRRASLSLLIFSNMGGLIGAVVGLCFWPFAWFSAHVPIPSAVACLMIPMLGWLVGRIRGRRPRREAMIGATACGLAAAALFTYISLALDTGKGNSPYMVGFTALFVFPFYAIAGIIFGLLDSTANIPGARSALAIIFFLFSTSAVQAQNGAVPIEKAIPNPIRPPEDGAVARAKKRLADRKLDEDAFKAIAEAPLMRSGQLFKYQRVEIKGILAHDDTDDSLNHLFDKQIEATHLGKKGNTVIAPPDWVRETWNGAKDLFDLRSDAFGEFSETARLAVEQLSNQDVEVNEIVAHSWGTEIVYNAILAGRINAPRRLIVCGMPDRDMEKWVALSRYTGTEVVVYANSHDPAARAARIVGGLTESAESHTERIARERIENEIIPGPSDFESQWKEACRRNNCNPHARQPPPPAFNYTYKGATHDRVEYYKAMIKDDVIPLADSDAFELRDRQDARIKTEAARLYAAAVEREIANEIPDGSGSSSDFSFLGSLQQGAANIDAMRKDARKAHAEWMHNHGAAERRLAEVERYRAVLESQRPRQPKLEEMNAEAEQCGFTIIVTNGVFNGFKDANQSRWIVNNGKSLDAVDLRLVFLITRACDSLNWPGQIDSVPKVCNDSAPALSVRTMKETFDAFGFSDQGDAFECRNEILSKAWKISDSKSFADVVASFHKKKNRNRKESRGEPAEKESSESREARPPRNDGKTPPPSRDHDEVWRRINPILR